MRQWRRRNRERSRVYNREYQRKTADRRKLRQIARDAESNAEGDPKCAYGCGRRASQTIERIDPRTWQPVSVPYCGSC